MLKRPVRSESYSEPWRASAAATYSIEPYVLGSAMCLSFAWYFSASFASPWYFLMTSTAVPL